MSLLIGLLSFVLVLTCLFLGLLILVQLPKKEAGMGTAFGGEAAAAMFGAGSGNALTQMTKYSAAAFMILCLVLTVLNSRLSKSRTEGVRKALSSAPAPAAVVAGSSNTVTAPALVPTNAVPATNVAVPAN